MIRVLITFTTGGERSTLVEQHLVIHGIETLEPRYARAAVRHLHGDELPNNVVVWESPPLKSAYIYKGYRLYPNSAFLVSRVVRPQAEWHIRSKTHEHLTG